MPAADASSSPDDALAAAPAEDAGARAESDGDGSDGSESDHFVDDELLKDADLRADMSFHTYLERNIHGFGVPFQEEEEEDEERRRVVWRRPQPPTPLSSSAAAASPSS